VTAREESVDVGMGVEDEPHRHPTRDRPRRVRAAWVVGLLALVLLPLVIVRVGTDKLTLSPDAFQEQISHGTWRDMFAWDGVAVSSPVALWVLALLAAGAIGFPYAWLAARSLPDRGYALSRVVGLLLVTWVVWWMATLRVLPFTRLAIVVGALIVTAGAAAIAVTDRGELVAWIRSSWRLVLVGEGIFWVLFAAALFVRWSNPDLWHETRGGEKPMDFAYLNAVTKSSYFPPYDPWFAGGEMNYYYYGFVQVAGLAKITAIPPAIAYNLAIPTLVGLLGAASFCAALGLISSRESRRRRAVIVATLAALLVAVAGNLGEIRVLRSALGQSIPNDWWFWNPTRVIRPGEGEPGPITEFPAFTFIYGDLHAHAMALPLAALAVALTIAIVRDTGSRRSLPLRLGLLGVALGALSVTNTWDLPTYGLVAVCGLGIALLSVDRSRRTLALFGAAVVGLVAIAYLSFLPFHLRYESVFEGVERWQGTRTRLVDYLTVHGLFLFAITSALVAQLAFARDLGSITRSYRLGVRSWDRLGRFRDLRRVLVRPSLLHRVGVRAVPIALLLAVACGLLGQWPTATAVAILTLALLSWPARRLRRTSARDQALRRLVILFVALGLCLTIAVEFFVVRNIDIGRTNTVFKLYLQAWLLWALAAAVSIGVVYERLPRIRRAVREPWRAAFVLLLAVAFLYPVLAARAKIDDRFDRSVGRTLDGTAFMRNAVFSDKEVAMPLAYDRDAIRWMHENVDGSPIVAEVNTAPTLYGWQGRYSIHTGNPTIVGWDFHQRQQRPAQSALVRARVADVQEAYRTTDAGAAYRILSRYGASYVVVGPLERAYFAEGTAKWSEGVGRFWTLAYENPGVRIYRLVSGETSPAEAVGASGSS
jgi:YYY domain-containing protein